MGTVWSAEIYAWKPVCEHMKEHFLYIGLIQLWCYLFITSYLTLLIKLLLEYTRELEYQQNY